MRGYVLGAIFFAVALAIFVFQNDSQAAIKFLGWTSPKVSIALVTLVAACSGALVTFFVDGMRYFKVARKLKETLTENARLNSQLKKLQDDRNSKKTSKTTNSQTAEPEKTQDK
ncbi:MAG TPA: LapA family protein [Syntrophomonadaceae bacterium]|nr:LapA family protein [Syntrophomonadaceae bacterium]